jgi:putative Mg2+ transporter-C (MgtC) family protein
LRFIHSKPADWITAFFKETRENIMTEPYISYLLRLIIALAVGAAIGLEREFMGKPAGLRTLMLLCIGSCLIMIISIEVARIYPGIADPGRIAAQAVTGIGFLGAGAIIRSRFHVTGITTAATIWVLCALGLAIGAGYFLLAVAGAVLITITLVLIRYIEDIIRRKRSTHVIQLLLEKRAGILGCILEQFTSMNVQSEALEVNRSGEDWSATFEYNLPLEKHHKLVAKLSNLEGVREVTEL